MCEHFVQFYQNEEYLINEISSFIGPAMQAGAAGIVIATRPHLNALEQRLNQEVANAPPSRYPSGTYLPLDAEALLDRFMMNGMPDETRFNAVMDEVFRQAGVGSCERVLAFGEMVALLAGEGRHAAALQLEAFWNKLAGRYHFSLLCAYPMAHFAEIGNQDLFQAICEAHTRVWPGEAVAPGSAGDDQEPAAPFRVVRDGFSMPPDDYDILHELKQRLLAQKRDVTKSGLLRAGLRQLRDLSPEELTAAMDALAPIKQGRPAKT